MEMGFEGASRIGQLTILPVSVLKLIPSSAGNLNDWAQIAYNLDAEGRDELTRVLSTIAWLFILLILYLFACTS